MVSVDDHETGRVRGRTASRVGPFLAGAQPVLVESNVPSFAEIVADTFGDLRGDGGRTEATVLRVERAPQMWLTSPWELHRDGSRSGRPCPTRA